MKPSQESLLETYLTSDDLTAATDGWKDLRVPAEHISSLMCELMTNAVAKGDAERESVSKLITALKQQSLITSLQFVDVRRVCLTEME